MLLFSRISPHETSRSRSLSPHIARGPPPDTTTTVLSSSAGYHSNPISTSLPPYAHPPPPVVVGRVTVHAPGYETPRKTTYYPPLSAGHVTITDLTKQEHKPVSRGLEDVKWIYTPPTNPNYKNKPQPSGKDAKVTEEKKSEDKQQQEDRQQSSIAKERRKALLEQSKSGSKVRYVLFSTDYHTIEIYYTCSKMSPLKYITFVLRCYH